MISDQPLSCAGASRILTSFGSTLIATGTPGNFPVRTPKLAPFGLIVRIVFFPIGPVQVRMPVIGIGARMSPLAGAGLVATVFGADGLSALAGCATTGGVAPAEGSDAFPVRLATSGAAGTAAVSLLWAIEGGWGAEARGMDSRVPRVRTSTITTAITSSPATAIQTSLTGFLAGASGRA